jgi:hypothetical protein
MFRVSGSAGLVSLRRRILLFALRTEWLEAETADALALQRPLRNDALRIVLVKQRLARAGQGKSGGYRTVIAFRRGDRAVFLYGFAKMSEATFEELDEFRHLARGFRA